MYMLFLSVLKIIISLSESMEYFVHCSMIQKLTPSPFFPHKTSFFFGVGELTYLPVWTYDNEDKSLSDSAGFDAPFIIHRAALSTKHYS